MAGGGALAEIIIAVAVHELLLGTAIAIAINGVDDLLIDAIYFVRRGWRALTIYNRHLKAHSGDLTRPPQPGRFAILIPAWDEAAVIVDMLRHSLATLDHPDYLIIVGVYPNDPATQAAVRGVADPRVRLAVNPRPGPTTKADCLNRLWLALREEEDASGRRFTAIVLHDAEDVVHSAELHLFDALIDRFDLIQLPVLPLPDPGSRWIAGSYIDEFAEAHAKDLVVREAIGAALPSAGVGCAISRDALDRLAALRGGAPFDQHSLTEDYELGLYLGNAGGRSAMVRIPGGVGRPVVCTREHFPATLDAAVRQKARWLTGIALAGWDRLGWRGGLAENYMRWRDRKALLATFATLAGYGATLLFITFSLVGDRLLPPHLIALMLGGEVTWLLWFNGLLLLWRLALRTGFTTVSHGWREGLRAPPRALVSNAVAILAALRAIRLYRHARRDRRAPLWEKTLHRFPADVPGE